MIDKQIILRKSKHIGQYVDEVRKYLNKMTPSQILHNNVILAFIERNF